MSETQQFLVEIQCWNCGYFVQLSPASTPPEYRFQGGLLFTSSLEIEGRVLAPRSHEGRPMRLWVRTSGSDRDEPEPLLGLGWIGERAPQGVVELQATLELAGMDLPAAAACLAASWKYIRIDARNAEGYDPNVTAYTFSRT